MSARISLVPELSSASFKVAILSMKSRTMCCVCLISFLLACIVSLTGVHLLLHHPIDCFCQGPLPCFSSHVYLSWQTGAVAAHSNSEFTMALQLNARMSSKDLSI